VVDANGNVYVTGGSYGGDPLSGGSFDDWATIAYSSEGTPLWTNIYAATGSGATALAVDASENVVVIAVYPGTT